MKKFEIIRKADGVSTVKVSNIAEIPTADIIKQLPDEAYSFKIDYKPKTQQQVLNFIENHADEITTAAPETQAEPVVEEPVVEAPVRVSKVSELYPATVRDFDIPSTGIVALYTRYMEDGRFKSTYTQMKTFDKVEDAQTFIDKKIAKESKYTVGLNLIIDGVHQGAVVLYTC